MLADFTKALRQEHCVPFPTGYESSQGWAYSNGRKPHHRPRFFFLTEGPGSCQHRNEMIKTQRGQASTGAHVKQSTWHMKTHFHSAEICKTRGLIVLDHTLFHTLTYSKQNLNHVFRMLWKEVHTSWTIIKDFLTAKTNIYFNEFAKSGYF